MSFDHQVAGHKDQLCFHPEDKRKLIKFCNRFEAEFYDDMRHIDSPLNAFLPYLYEIEKDRIVISNLAYNFKVPNIIDIKLGTVLYDNLASDEKKDRMKKVAASTTSGSLGFRICGMKVFQADSCEYKVYDGHYGKSLNDDTVSEGFRAFVQDTTQEELASIIKTLKEIESAYQASNVVLVSASILIIYEGSSKGHRNSPSINLIDFAHSKVISEEEKDRDYKHERMGVLFGLRNISKILESIAIKLFPCSALTNNIN